MITYTPSKRYARPCWPLKAYTYQNERKWDDLTTIRTNAGYHLMNCGEMSLAFRTSVYPIARKVLAVAHPHPERVRKVFLARGGG